MVARPPGLTGLRPSPTRHDVGNCRFKGKLTQGPAVSVADRHHSLRRGIMTMTRSAYVQVRCAVVALWSERHQRYAAKTGPETLIGALPADTMPSNAFRPFTLLYAYPTPYLA